MKHLLLVVTFCILIACGETKKESTPTPVSNTTKTESFEKVEALSWVLGDWVNLNTETSSYEHWERETDSSFVAFSLTLRGQDTVFHEQMRLYQENNLLLLYVETVGDDPNPVVFSQKESAQHPFTFENPRNEFPSQIVYTLPEDTKIHAWVAGFIDGVPQKQDFYFTKATE